MADNVNEQANKKLCKRCKIRYIPINDPTGLCLDCLMELEEEENRKKRLNQQLTEEDDENLKDDDDDDEEDEDQDDDDDDDNNDQDDNNNDDNQDQDNNNQKQDSDDKNSQQKDDKNKPDSDEPDSANGRRNDNSDIDDELKSDKKPKGQDNSKLKDGHESQSQTSQTTSQTTTTAETTSSTTTATSTAGAEAGAEAGASAGASAGGSAAAGAGGGAAGALGIVIIVLIIIIMAVGIIAFFVEMPGMVVDRIGEAISDVWRDAQIFVNGSRANQIMITKKDMAEAGEYLVQMGYDLNGFGFLTHDGSEDEDDDGTPKPVTNLTKLTAKVDNTQLSDVIDWTDFITGEWDTKFGVWLFSKMKQLDTDAYDASQLPLTDFSTGSIADRTKDADPSEEAPEYVTVYVYNYKEGQSESEIRKNIKLVLDSSGNVGFVMSKYLGMYLSAENSTYLIRNFYTDANIKAGKLFGRKVEEDEGCGMIYFTTDEEILPSDYIENIDEDECEFINCEESLEDKLPEFAQWIKDAVMEVGKTMVGLPYYIVDKVSEAQIIDLVAVDRSTKTMRVYNGNDGWQKVTYYDYPLDGWVSRYGIPLQLSLTMHLSTLAPDFAYNFAQIAAINKVDNPDTEEDEGSGTVTEIGLLEVKNNAMKSKLLLDLGEEEGEKFYYLEKTRTSDFHPHRVSSGETGKGEQGVKTIEEAKRISDNTYPEYMKKSIAQIATDNYEGNVLKWLDDTEEAIKQTREANGGEKLYAGTFVCKSTSFNSSASIASQRVAEYYYTIEDTYLASICYGLKALEIIKEQDDGSIIVLGPSSPMAPDNSEEALSKARRIIVENFKFRPIQDFMYCEYSDEDGIRGGSLNWNGTGSLVMDIKDDLTYSGNNTYQRYYYNGTGSTMNAKKGAPITIYETEGDGVAEDGTVYNSGYMGMSGDYYFVPNVASLYDVYIMHNISNYHAPNESVEGDMMLFWRHRDYYRLVSVELDEDGKEVITPAPLGNGNFDDYSYMRDEKTNESGSLVGYYKNSDGWFWRNSIPNALINAINAKLEDEELTAEDVRTLLDDMFEYNIGEIDEETGEVTDGFTKRIPILLEVKNHWYQDISFKGDSTGGYCYYWDTSENYRKRTYMHEATDADKEATRKASNAGLVFLEEISPGSVVQIKDGQRVGKAGEKVKRLLNYKYDKFDGTGQIAENDKITFSETAVDALAMLEQIEGEDSQDIIRDFKRLMRDFNIRFKEKKQTALKQKLFVNTVDGIDSPDKLLPEGDDTVIRAKLPPTQEDGFEEGTPVRAPMGGKIEYITEDAICIRITEAGEAKDYTILISGFKVNEGLGDSVGKGGQLGVTKKQDVKLTLRDENGAIVQNEYSMETLISASENGHRTEEDIIKACQNFGLSESAIANIRSMMDGLMRIQSEFNIDPLAAIAVIQGESGCGTAYPGEYRLANIMYWTGQQGVTGFSSNGFGQYANYNDAIYDFGNYVTNRFERPLETMEELESFDGLAVFENAATTDREIYLQLINALATE
ncbi:MAG: hypothetical protein IJH39_02120 [Clostridia bacterium]|nr:hypothetical protein [Clostridia bacterium]